MNKKKLLLAQQEMPKILFDATNPFFKSKFTTLSNLLNEVVPVLNKNGLILSQPLSAKIVEKGTLVTSQIIDAESGEILAESSVFISYPTDSGGEGKKTSLSQKHGGDITYFRRYTLLSLLALAAEDDDGNNEEPQGAHKAIPNSHSNRSTDIDYTISPRTKQKWATMSNENLMLAKNYYEGKDPRYVAAIEAAIKEKNE